MLAYVIFALTFLATLIAAVLYLYPSSKKPSTIPGIDAVSEDEGNFGDIARAGSLHEFLLDLHKRFGPIASFWWGRHYTVSISDPELFKHHHNVFDRPPELFMMFEPLITIKCIQFANFTEGRARRHMFDKAMTSTCIHRYFGLFQEVADELVKKWDSKVNEEHIALGQYMAMFALKAVLLSLFGETMKNEKKILQFKSIYDVVWGEMEQRLKEPPTEAREKMLKEGKKKVYEVIGAVVEHRKNQPPEHGEELMLDLIMDYAEETDNKDIELCDALTYVIGGFHTTGNLLTWGFYFLATHPECEAKVVKELQEKLGDEDVDYTNIDELVYLRQVIDESLRCAVIGPYAARFQDFDSELGGHKIPKNTPVLHALGVASKNEKYFPLPDKFDPERFSPENAKKRPNLAFVPFGFAGKRVCPGKAFAYAEAFVAFASILKKFKLTLVKGQVIEPVHGLVTHPSEEIWVTLSRR